MKINTIIFLWNLDFAIAQAYNENDFYIKCVMRNHGRAPMEERHFSDDKDLIDALKKIVELQRHFRSIDKKL